jgi:N-acetylglucosamine-6-phosphate deacetylase
MDRMVTNALVNGRVLRDAGFVDGLAVLIDDGRISAVVPRNDQRVDAAVAHDLRGQRLMPGFIDTQVNGGGGVLFNDAPTVDSIRAIGRAHRRFGTTGFLPTLISDDLHVIEEALAAVREAIRVRVPGVLGIHIEGPFLNPARKGAHDPAKLRTLDAAAVRLLATPTGGRTMLTLAPEMTDSNTLADLARAGIILSAGHTNADYETIREALAAGLTGFTHLFNAMSPLTSREPGAVGAALEDQESWCGLIADGRHVHPAVLRVALRARRRDRFMLVTDALSSVGMDDTSFTMQGRVIQVVDGVCVDENGTLAGSNLDMAGAVRNIMAMAGLEVGEAVELASANPAGFLGLSGELGAIARGRRANLVLADGELKVLRTWIGGR